MLDTEKYTREGQKWIEAGLAEDNEIIPIAGVDFVMSTNVPLVANLPNSGKSSYATYISADEMMFSIALGGFEDVPNLNIGHNKLRYIGERPILKVNPEATWETRESVEAIREATIN